MGPTLNFLLLRGSRALLLMAFGLLPAFAAPDGTTAESSNPDMTVEYGIKAAYLYNFTRFIEWPPAALPAHVPFVVGVLARDPVLIGAIRESFRGKLMANGRAIEVKVFTGLTPDLLACQLVFVGRNAAEKVADVRAAVGSRPILIVGDTAGSAQQGGEIDFAVSADVVRIEINLQRAEQIGLKLSGRLANVARLVRDRAP